MTTSAAPTPPPIVVLGSGKIASALADVGFRAVTGTSFTDSAVTINKHLADHPATPVIADMSMAGELGFDFFVTDLAERAADAGTRLVILPTDPDNPLATPGKVERAVVVPLPATVADVVRAAGFQLPPIPAADVVIEPDRAAVVPAPIPVPMPMPLPIARTEPAPEPIPAPAEEITEPAPVDEESAGADDELERARRAREAELDAQMAALNARMEAEAAAFDEDYSEDDDVDTADAAQADGPRNVVEEARAAVEGFDQMPEFMRRRILEDLASENHAVAPAAPVRMPVPVPTTPEAPADVDRPRFRVRTSDTASTFAPAPQAAPVREAEPVTGPAFERQPEQMPEREPADLVPRAIPVPAPFVPEATPAWPDTHREPTPAWAEPAAEPAAPAFTVPPAYTPTAPTAPTRVPTPNLYTGGEPVLPAQARRGVLVVVAAGSGGVGKTSTAIDMAKIASETINPATGKALRVVIVDANRGQPDVHKRMRVPEGIMPTVYDVIATGQPSSALVIPSMYNQYRAAAIDDPLAFACVFGPPAVDAEATPAFAYAQAIDYARANADIVIVDTQIIEATQSDIFREVLIPRLREDGWLVAAYDHKGTSKDNIFERLSELVGRDGIARSRVLIIARNVYAFPQEAVEQVERMVGSNGTFVGAMMHDDAYERDTDIGRFRTDLPAIAPVIGRLLYTVTGNHAFLQAAQAAEQQVPKKSRGLLGWIRR